MEGWDLIKDITKRHFMQLAALSGMAQFAPDIDNVGGLFQMTEEITSRQFDGIKFVQKRINHNETGYDDIPKELAAKYGSGNAKNLPLDPKIAELARLLVSINSGCVYCSILHSKEARDLGILPAKIDALRSWRETQLFTEMEAAVLHYTETVSELNQPEIQAAHDQLKQHLEPAQIEALLMIIVNMDLWTRIFLAQGRQPELL